MSDNDARRLRVILFALICLPLILIAAKSPGLPTSPWLTTHASLESFPERLQNKMTHILFVPLGAVIVVLVRLTLGLRVLGPFRSILLAVAFQATGPILGMVFLAATIALVAGIRPSIRSLRLPYFGRITVMLSAVAVIMIGGAVAGQWFDVALLQTVVTFPIVVLCLVADAFARTMIREGIRSALWRATITALVALALAGLAAWAPLKELLIRYPELLLIQIASIIVISRFLNWRLLERLNPKCGRDEKDRDEPEAVRRPSSRTAPVRPRGMVTIQESISDQVGDGRNTSRGVVSHLG